MSAESHKRYLQQRALREAQKAIDRHGREAFTRDEFRSLRIQTVETWKRIFLALFGALSCAGGIYALREDVVWLAILLLILGSLCIVAAIFGAKQTVDAALTSVDVVTMFDNF